VASEHELGEVGTEIAPELAPDSEGAARVDALLRHVCHLARSLTGAEQAAMALQATVDEAPRKYFTSARPTRRGVTTARTPRGAACTGSRYRPATSSG